MAGCAGDSDLRWHERDHEGGGVALDLNGTGPGDAIVAAYDRAASELAPRYDAIPAGAAFTAVRDLFPPTGCALDVGAGTGRDARWLRSLGFEVVAAEPAAGLRAYGAARSGCGLRWIDDRLPSFDRVSSLGLQYDLILMSAVWQHVAPQDRPHSLRSLAALLKPGGLLAMTLRSGPFHPDRPAHPTSISEIQSLAHSHGLKVARARPAEDLQKRADVEWTCAALRRPIARGLTAA